MCLDEPPQDEPLCVKWCLSDALTYVDGDEEEVKEDTADEMDMGLDSLVKKHGLRTVMESLAKMKEKES